jgi:ParB family transcriptional regulator, chromosome partitioning protein
VNRHSFSVAINEESILSARQALGKGLSALIPDRADKIVSETNEKKIFQFCGIEEIQPNPHQPRKKFDDQQLQELVDSIREKGILLPLVVRRKGTSFELIAGERRWRAAQRAGVKEVPILVKDVSESEILELSLIENIQREDLNPIEEADAYKALMDQFHLTQEEISKKVGKDRTTITNIIRLLKLPPEIRQSLSEGAITMGHARAFLGLEGPEKQKLAFKKVLAEGLSVRQTEALVKRLGLKKTSSPTKNTSQWDALIEELQRILGTKVHITGQGERGKIEIEFYSPGELDRLIDVLKR